MTPLPKRRISTRRGGKRRAALHTRLAGLVTCPNCKKLRIPHRACIFCGFYDGREIVKHKVKKEKK